MSSSSTALAEEARHKRSVAHDEARPACDVVEGRPNQTHANDSGTFPRSTRRELVRLAWPIAAALLGEVALGLVDTKLAGGLGAAALAGVGVGTMLMFLSYSIVFGLMRGVTVRTAHALGEGRPDDGFAFARAGLLLGALVGAIVLVLGRDVSPLLVFIHADPALVPHARDFFAAVTLGAPAACALAALVQHRRGVGDARTPMVAGIAGNVLNGVLAWALMYGHLGAPALGVRGAGLATALVEVLEFAALLAVFARDEARARRAARQAGRELHGLSLGAAVREVASLGVPTGAQFGAETLAFATFTAVLSGISKEEIASHQIALAVIRVSFLPGVAVSEAASVLVGQSLGRRHLAEADAVAKDALRLAVGFMALCGVGFAIFGGALARMFSADETVALLARRLLFVAAVFQVLDAVNIVLRGALRGAKDVRAVALLGVFVVWSCVPTAAYVLGKLAGLGALGGWLGFVAETTLGAALFWRRWTRGGWRLAYETPNRK